jgi:hypothetical protein
MAGDHLTSHWIGTGSGLSWTFSGMEADVLITTTPDLQTMELRKSKNDVYYIYAPHSMISRHMGYRPGAFDYFDAILCTGAYQVDEIGANESRHGLSQKALIEQGYCQLDSLSAP